MVTEFGLSYEKVANRLGCGAETVRRWVAAYRQELKPTQLQQELDVAKELQTSRKRISQLEMEVEFLKKAGGLPSKSIEEKYAKIKENSDSYPIDVMCQLLEVSRSGYYAHLTRKPSRTEEKRKLLDRIVSEIYQTENPIPGYHKIHHKINARGISCSPESVRLACLRVKAAQVSEQKSVKVSQHSAP